MNQETLARLQAQVRIGGKGSVRRKRKVVHSSGATSVKKLQSALKQLNVKLIQETEEVNMIKDDGTVLHFENPTIEASLGPQGSNMFVVSGHGTSGQITDMFPSILNQLGPDNWKHFQEFVSATARERDFADGDFGDESEDDDEGIPELAMNFDEVSKDEANGVELNGMEEASKDEANLVELNGTQEVAEDFVEADASAKETVPDSEGLFYWKF